MWEMLVYNKSDIKIAILVDSHDTLGGHTR